MGWVFTMKIEIFGQDYEIKRAPLTQSELYGFCDRAKKEIVIDNKIRGEKYTVTLIHELIHAIFCELSITETLEHNQEEIINDNIAKCLAKNFYIKKKPNKIKKK